MEIEIKEYDSLHDDAMKVRKEVFVKEQGFIDEFDDTDKISTHLVAYGSGRPIATCRFFTDSEEDDTYILGRLAVVKDWRKNHLGAEMIKKAEELIKQKNGKVIKLHSQEQATGFYKKQGYTVCSEMEYEEYCPHYWMKKDL